MEEVRTHHDRIEMNRHSFLHLARQALALALWPVVACATDIPWVWHSSGPPERAQELAVLLDHLQLSGDAIEVRQRKRLLIVDKSTCVTPVVHVQSNLSRMPRLGSHQTDAIRNAVKAAAARSTSGWVQLDFEALESQRPYYFGLVAALRRDLPASIKLSVTILASWCEEKGLLDKLTADEVVPMFFRMGMTAEDYQHRLQHTPERFDSRCRQQAAGFAIQEAPPAAVQQRYARRYWFNFRNWDGFTGE